MTSATQRKTRPESKRAAAIFDVTPVWQQVTPELKQELLDFWKQNNAIGNARQADARAQQVVCIARDEHGALCAVSTVVLKVLPRLRQPLYYFRLFFAKSVRGQGQTTPFFNSAKDVLQAYNAGLASPESLGMLVELESRYLTSYCKFANMTGADLFFIGYSPRGLQLRVSYFKDALLMQPVALNRLDPLPRG